MKSALLLHGHMRTFDKCFPELEKNLLSKYSPDIFIHTWNLLDSTTASWYKGETSESSYVNEDEIIKTYNPKNIIVEAQRMPDETNKLINSSNLFGFSCMYESLSKSCDLKSQYEKKNEFKYDLVIKIRPDIFLQSEFPTFEINELERYDIFIAGNKKNSHPKSIDDYLAVDIINAGKSENMDKTCDLYYNIKSYFSEENNENGFIKYVKDIGFKYKMLSYDYNSHWHIKRLATR